MKDENTVAMTVKQFASMGGKARAKKLSKKRRKEIAMKAGLANKARLNKLKGEKKTKKLSTVI